MKYNLAATWENVSSYIYSQRRLKSASKFTQSDQCLCCLHAETLHPWLLKIRPVKILIRLRECAGWSESSLGAHVRRYVFWRCGSNRKDYNIDDKTGIEFMILHLKLRNTLLFSGFKSVLTNILNVNTFLSPVKIKPQLLCYCCHLHEETVIRLLWQCSTFQQILTKLSYTLQSSDSQCNITENAFLFGMKT